MSVKSILMLCILFLAPWVGVCVSPFFETLPLDGQICFILYVLLIITLTIFPGIIGLWFANKNGIKLKIFEFDIKKILLACLFGLSISLFIHIFDGQLSISHAFFYSLIGVLFGTTVSLLMALGETVFWWGFLYSMFNRLGIVRCLCIIAFSWGIWNIPMVLLGRHYEDHADTGIILMPLFIMAISPLMYWLRKMSNSILVPAAFYGSLNFSTFVSSMIYETHYNPIIHGITGFFGITIMSFISCIILIFQIRNMKNTSIT